MTSARTDARLVTAVAAALTAGVVVVALLVRHTYAAPARLALAFGFAGVEPRVQSALSIFAANARLLAAAIAAAAVTQLPWCARRSGQRAAIGTLLIAALDALLALEVAFNVVLVGAALGAYGHRMIAAVLPHGPFELTAFASALALYLRGRRAAITRGRIATTAAGGLTVLALAAVLETYAAP